MPIKCSSESIYHIRNDKQLLYITGVVEALLAGIYIQLLCVSVCWVEKDVFVSLKELVKILNIVFSCKNA